MEDGKEVTSPRMDRLQRDRINAMTKELHFGKFSNTIAFLLVIFDLLFKGREFKDTSEMIIFVQNLLKEKELLARENRELKSKLGKIQKVIDE